METKDIILKSAATLFAQNGKDGIGIRGIAEASGVSVNTVMYHFENKENLFLSVVQNLVSREIPFDRIFNPLQVDGGLAPYEISNRLSLVIRNLFDVFTEEERLEQVDFLVHVLFLKNENAAKTLMEAFDAFDGPIVDFLVLTGVEFDKQTFMFIAYVLWSQLLFNISARHNVMADLGVNELSKAYYHDVARRISQVFCQQLNLPPHDEGIWTRET